MAWEKVGDSEGIWTLIPGPDREIVVNTETGEAREIYVGSSQTTGEAIENGQFTERDMSIFDRPPKK